MGSRLQPALPTFFVVGAAKCGTTSLHHYLDMHPEIGMSREKEPHFFTQGRGAARGETWYRSLFDASMAVRGESSVGYSMSPHQSGIPKRIKEMVPDAKFVYVVRDPVARFVSDHMHRVSDGLETRSIDEAAHTVDGSVEGDRGRYLFQIEQYLEHFSRHRIHVLTTERLRLRRRETLSALFAFLRVEPSVWGREFERVLHESRHFRSKGKIGILLRRFGRSRMLEWVPANTRREVGKILYRPFTRTLERPTLSTEARQHLARYYRDDVAALREFLDDPLEEWRV